LNNSAKVEHLPKGESSVQARFGNTIDYISDEISTAATKNAVIFLNYEIGRSLLMYIKRGYTLSHFWTVIRLY